MCQLSIRVAVRCSVFCSVLQRVAVCCSVLQSGIKVQGINVSVKYAQGKSRHPKTFD